MINLLTAILVADVLRELFVAAMASRLAFRSSCASTDTIVAVGVSILSVAVLVFVVAWLACSTSWPSTCAIVALGGSKLTGFVFVNMFGAVREPNTVAVVDARISAAVAEALA